jgi:hypothetical protein
MGRPSSVTSHRAIAWLTSIVVSAGFLVVIQGTPAGADTTTFTSTEIGSSGSRAEFSQSGPWTLTWSYDCSAFGSQGNFSVNVNQPSDDLTDDLGVNELGNGGNGVDYYYDSGQFSLDVISECTWSVTVAPSGAGSLAAPVTFTSAQTGDTGNPQKFSVGGKWTMAWSYDCSAFGSSGNFAVGINQPAGDETFDVGPNELGPSGSGTDSYNDTGTFSLDIISECSWSITINSSSTPTPPQVPPTTPTPLVTPSAVGMTATSDSGGYWIAYSDGEVHVHGDAVNLGDLQGHTLNAPINHIVSTPDGKGYWLVAADGGIFTFGDAPFYGSTGGQHLNAPVVDMAPTADGLGYWLVASDGGIFSFGDAQFHGSTGSLHLNKPVVGMASVPDGGGYWLVASDGGIFAFGTAPFLGSAGSLHLNKPVNGMAATSDGGGYWFVASDGGIFSFGDAQFHGSTGNIRLNAPIVGMAADDLTGGYWLLGSDGGIFSESAQFFGAG